MRKWLALGAICLVTLITAPAHAAWLGINMTDYTSQDGSVRGVKILAVDPASPAASAGLRTGDVVVAVNSRSITSTHTISEILRPLSPGTSISIHAWRQGRTLPFTAVLHDVPPHLALMQRGFDLYAQGKYDAAIEILTQALELRRMSGSYWKRGQAYMAKRDYHRALADFNMAVETAPDDPWVYFNRGRLYYETGDYDRAIRDYNETLRHHAKHAGAFVHRGQAALAKGLYEQAVADSSKALELEPKYSFAYHVRGVAKRKMNRLDDALDDYNRAIQLDPSVVELYNNRASVYFAQGKFDRAVDDWTKALTINDKDPVLYENRALAHEKKGDRRRAGADREQAAKTYMDRGLAHAGGERYADAAAQYTAGLALNTRYSPPLYYNRGVSYEKQGLDSQALADYTKAIEANADFAEAYLRRGFVYAAKMQRYEDAKKDWEKAAGLDPDGKTGQTARRNLEKLKRMQ